MDKVKNQINCIVMKIEFQRLTVCLYDMQYILKEQTMTIVI